MNIQVQEESSCREKCKSDILQQEEQMVYYSMVEEIQQVGILLVNL